MVVTPGHRFLRPDGSFEEIGRIVADCGALGGQIVDVTGQTVTVTAEAIRFGAATAHLFEEGEKLVASNAGALALAPEVKHGWRTYNFEVAETHTYIAGDIRVHNDSVLSTLRDGDLLVSLDDDLDNATVARDVDGDGRLEIVAIDGVHQGDNLVAYREYIYTAPAGMSDPLAAVEAHIAANEGRSYVGSDGQIHLVELTANTFDPGLGNGYGDGVVSDDMDEVLVDNEPLIAANVAIANCVTARNAPLHC